MYYKKVVSEGFRWTSNSIYSDDHSYNVITVVKHSLFPGIVPLNCIEGVKVGIQTFILAEVSRG